MGAIHNKMEYHAPSEFVNDMKGLKKVIINYTLPFLLSIYLPSSIGDHYNDSEIINIPAEIPEIIALNNQRTLDNKVL